MSTLGVMVAAQNLYIKNEYVILEEREVGKGEGAFKLITFSKSL